MVDGRSLGQNPVWSDVYVQSQIGLCGVKTVEMAALCRETGKLMTCCTNGHLD
jgi:hypothetical protein